MQPISANPLSAPVDNGLNDAAPVDCIDVGFDYPYDVILTALQSLPDQSIATTDDADFAWRAIVINVQTGAFNIRFSDSQGYYLSNSYIASANLIGDAASPFPIFPELLIPAGGRIGIDIADTSNAPNTIQLLARGVKRYRISSLAA